MNRMVIVILLVLCSGCGANHVIPDDNYTFRDTSRENSAFRVAFDQDGNPYPSDLRQRPVNKEKKPCFRYCGFQLKNGQYNDFEYTGKTDEMILDQYASAINEALSGKEKIVFFVHGYNNSYEEIDEMMAQFHRAISPDEQETVVVEVVWDGLVSNGWFTHWFDSLTYSNLAGQFGVRRLLNRIDGKGKSLYFVTHSRGAGVAMSTLFDPVYDSHIRGPNGDVLADDFDYEAFSNDFSKVSLIMMAPAVGKGHFTSDLSDEIPENTSLTLVLKNRDEATSKLILAKLFGTTVAGYDSKLVKQLEKKGVVRVERLGKDDAGWLDDHFYQSYLDKAVEQGVFRESGL